MNTIRPLFSKYMAGPLAVAAVAVAAAPADARPVIDSIDLERASTTTTRVEVELERASVGSRPNVRVWVAGRSTTLRVVGRDEDGDILTARTLRWSTREYDRYRVRVRVCDRGTCTSMTRRVPVDDDRVDRGQGAAQRPQGIGAAQPPRASVNANEAARIAQERFGGFVENVWREDDFGAAWEVELEDARFDGGRRDLDVYVDRAGRIVNVVVDREEWDRDARSPRVMNAVLSGGSTIAADEAARIAQERFGGSIDDISREDDYGASWEIELERSNDAGRDLDVYVDDEGRIVQVKRDGEGRGRDDRDGWSAEEAWESDAWGNDASYSPVIGPDEAARIAQERFGGEVHRVDEEEDGLAIWAVELRGDWNRDAVKDERSWWGGIKGDLRDALHRIPLIGGDRALEVYVGADGRILDAHRD